MARTSALRASDTDRDSVAERLRAAAVEGRIDADELEERLHLALRARTYGDLRRLVADLPATPARWSGRRRTAPAIALATAAVALRVAVVLVAAAVVAAVLVFTAAWWIVCAIVWMTMRGRRASWRAGPTWRPPRARRI